MKKILITGVNGFVGSHLAARLLATGGVELIGLHLDGNFTSIDSIKESIDLVQCDLLDSDKVAEVVARVCPDTIYHLAALLSTRAVAGNQALPLEDHGVPGGPRAIRQRVPAA